MNKTKDDRIKAIIEVKENQLVIDRVINYINLELNINLYKDYSNNININDNNSLILNKSYYRQVVRRLLNLIERHSLKEKLLFEEMEKGSKILKIKEAATVKSPSYDGSESGKQENGYKANTQEKLLIDIEEERLKQAQRINAYDLFTKSFTDNKELTKEFIELAPNTRAVEIMIRHYFNGERYCDIARKMMYEEVYNLEKRAVDDLSLILMYSL